MWENYSSDKENFTGHIFNIKLEEKSYKMSFKDLPVKIQRSKNRPEGGGEGGQNVPPPLPHGADSVKKHFFMVLKDYFKYFRGSLRLGDNLRILP